MELCAFDGESFRLLLAVEVSKLSFRVVILPRTGVSRDLRSGEGIEMGVTVRQAV